MEFELSYDVPRVPLFEGGAARIVGEELDRAMNASVLHLKGQVLPLTPVNTGMLRRGVATKITGEGVSIVGRVFDPVTYAVPVEMGTRPHWPPLAPIILWVRRKFGIRDDREARSVGFLVARKIARRGTPPREFFRRGFEQGRGRVESFFVAARARILARLTSGSGG